MQTTLSSVRQSTMGTLLSATLISNYNSHSNDIWLRISFHELPQVTLRRSVRNTHNLPYSFLEHSVGSHNSQVEHFQLAHQPHALTQNETYEHIRLKKKKKKQQATTALEGTAQRWAPQRCLNNSHCHCSKMNLPLDMHQSNRLEAITQPINFWQALQNLAMAVPTFQTLSLPRPMLIRGPMLIDSWGHFKAPTALPKAIKSSSSMFCRLVCNLKTTVLISAWYFVHTEVASELLRKMAAHVSMWCTHESHQLVSVYSWFLWQSQEQKSVWRWRWYQTRDRTLLASKAETSSGMAATAGQLVWLSPGLFSSYWVLSIKQMLCATFTRCLHIWTTPACAIEGWSAQVWNPAVTAKWYTSYKAKCNF